MKPRTKLVASHKGQPYEARLLKEGQVEVTDGPSAVGAVGTLSGVAKRITGYEQNGWTFWKVVERGRPTPLIEFREELEP